MGLYFATGVIMMIGGLSWGIITGELMGFVIAFFGLLFCVPLGVVEMWPSYPWKWDKET